MIKGCLAWFVLAIEMKGKNQNRPTKMPNAAASANTARDGAIGQKAQRPP